MRIWSLHPEYLDAKGLVALWRETLLAKHVLEGKTSGYRNHPQLERFRRAERPLDSINGYLAAVYQEAVRRGYQFDRSKIAWDFKPAKLKVTKGQLEYEAEHLRNKLKIRDARRYQALAVIILPKVHPLFQMMEGGKEEWER